MADIMIPANWFVADTTVDGTYHHLVQELATMWKIWVERPTPGTLVIRHQTAPNWMWARKAQTATIVGGDVVGGARFTATGQTSKSAVIAIHRALGVPDEGQAPLPPTDADVADSALAQVQELAGLRDRGILTEEEFEAAKAKLLSEY